MATKRSRREEMQTLTVYGYIREIFESIPADLKEIILAFYKRTLDVWNVGKSDYSVNIDVDSGIVEAKFENNDNWREVYGSLIIKAGDTHTWNIQPLETQNVNILNVCIGIVDAKKANENLDPFLADEYGCGYGYYGGNGHIYNGMDREGQGRKLTKWAYPEMITLTLDMSDTDNKYGTLTMKKSDGEEEILQDKVDMKKQYYMAISLSLGNEESHNHYKIKMWSQ